MIGNPPYISAPTQIANKHLFKQREILINSGKYKSLYQKWDLYIPFIELGTQLNCKNGITAMIVPFPLTNQLYAKVLRKILVEENDLFELVDLNGTKIFENATVSNCIPFIKKTNTSGKTWISNIDEKLKIYRNFNQSNKNLVQDEKTYVWNVTQEKREANRHSDMNVLGDYCYISYGLAPCADEKVARGAFKREDLISDKYDSIHCRKYIEAKNIEKYCIKNNVYIEYYTERSPGQLRRATFNEWYEPPKIFCNILGELKVAIDYENKYIHNHALIGCALWHTLKGIENKSISASIKKFSHMKRNEMEKLSETVDLKYLLGILNSKYANVFLASLRGNDYHIYPEHIRNFPIPSASILQQKQIVDLVDKILSAKKGNPQTDTSDLEVEIDKLVYKLYGLSDEEINIIEK